MNMSRKTASQDFLRRSKFESTRDVGSGFQDRLRAYKEAENA